MTSAHEDAHVTGSHEDARPATRPAVCRRLQDQTALVRPAPTCRNAQEPLKSRLHGCNDCSRRFQPVGAPARFAVFCCCMIGVRTAASAVKSAHKAPTPTRRRTSSRACGDTEDTVLAWSKLGWRTCDLTALDLKHARCEGKDCWLAAASHW